MTQRRHIGERASSPYTRGQGAPLPRVSARGGRGDGQPFLRPDSQSPRSSSFSLSRPLELRSKGTVSICDIRNEIPTEADARQRLSSYVVVTIERVNTDNEVDNDGTPMLPSWEHCKRTRQTNPPKSQVTQLARELDRDTGSALQKKLQLDRDIQRQLERAQELLEEELEAENLHHNYHYVLRQFTTKLAARAMVPSHGYYTGSQLLPLSSHKMIEAAQRSKKSDRDRARSKSGHHHKSSKSKSKSKSTKFIVVEPHKTSRSSKGHDRNTKYRDIDYEVVEVTAYYMRTPLDKVNCLRLLQQEQEEEEEEEEESYGVNYVFRGRQHDRRPYRRDDSADYYEESPSRIRDQRHREASRRRESSLGHSRMSGGRDRRSRNSLDDRDAPYDRSENLGPRRGDSQRYADDGRDGRARTLSRSVSRLPPRPHSRPGPPVAPGLPPDRDARAVSRGRSRPDEREQQTRAQPPQAQVRGPNMPPPPVGPNHNQNGRPSVGSQGRPAPEGNFQNPPPGADPGPRSQGTVPRQQDPAGHNMPPGVILLNPQAQPQGTQGQRGGFQGQPPEQPHGSQDPRMSQQRPQGHHQSPNGHPQGQGQPQGQPQGLQGPQGQQRPQGSPAYSQDARGQPQGLQGSPGPQANQQRPQVQTQAPPGYPQAPQGPRAPGQQQQQGPQGPPLNQQRPQAQSQGTSGHPQAPLGPRTTGPTPQQRSGTAPPPPPPPPAQNMASGAPFVRINGPTPKVYAESSASSDHASVFDGRSDVDSDFDTSTSSAEIEDYIAVRRPHGRPLPQTEQPQHFGVHPLRHHVKQGNGQRRDVTPPRHRQIPNSPPLASLGVEHPRPMRHVDPREVQRAVSPRRFRGDDLARDSQLHDQLRRLRRGDERGNQGDVGRAYQDGFRPRDLAESPVYRGRVDSNQGPRDGRDPRGRLEIIVDDRVRHYSNELNPRSSDEISPLDRDDFDHIRHEDYDRDEYERDDGHGRDRHDAGRRSPDYRAGRGRSLRGRFHRQDSGYEGGYDRSRSPERRGRGWAAHEGNSLRRRPAVSPSHPFAPLGRNARFLDD